MEEIAMLVLSRKIGEKIVIDDTIVITVIAVNGNRVKIGIEAPAEVGIRRSEVEIHLPPEDPQNGASEAA